MVTRMSSVSVSVCVWVWKGVPVAVSLLPVCALSVGVLMLSGVMR